MSRNTEEFEALSVEAKALVGAWWSVMIANEVRFDRPWILHPRARRGLDDLVAAGYLTAAPLNQHKASPWLWKPTAKLCDERPHVSRGFLEANSFPITTDPKAGGTITVTAAAADRGGAQDFSPSMQAVIERLAAGHNLMAQALRGRVSCPYWQDRPKAPSSRTVNALFDRGCLSWRGGPPAFPAVGELILTPGFVPPSL